MTPRVHHVYHPLFITTDDAFYYENYVTHMNKTKQPIFLDDYTSFTDTSCEKTLRWFTGSETPPYFDDGYLWVVFNNFFNVVLCTTVRSLTVRSATRKPNQSFVPAVFVHVHKHVHVVRINRCVILLESTSSSRGTMNDNVKITTCDRISVEEIHVFTGKQSTFWKFMCYMPSDKAVCT